MSAWSTLLRVLLCLGLVLNGSGFALASPAPMEHPPVPAGELPPTAGLAAKDDAPCHGREHGAVRPATLAEDAPSPGSSVADSSEDASPSGLPDPACDCCESGLCRGTCMHQGQATVPAPSYCDEAPAGACDARRTGAAYASPALAHLIRPPIV